jgi:hypothetical protein
MNRWSLPILPALLLGAGCVMQESTTELVTPNPFTNSPGATAVTRVSFSPASMSAASRVDAMGRNVVAANPQLGLKPLFRTIGAPEPEIFHRGTVEVDVTEGLVKQCATDGQLAGVLLLELAKMVGEREAAAGPRARVPDRLPPIDIPVGNDYGGSFGSADQLHRAELAKFEKESRQRAASGPFDPQAVARSCLTKAGYAPTDLDTVLPILGAAADNRTFAKQMGSQPAITPPTVPGPAQSPASQ